LALFDERTGNPPVQLMTRAQGDDFRALFALPLFTAYELPTDWNSEGTAATNRRIALGNLSRA
jgi:hypothetical protein